MMQLETFKPVRPKSLPLALTVIFAVILNLVSCAFALAEDKAETLTGYLIDRSCAAMIKHDHQDPIPKLKAHTKVCSLEPSCCEAGYTVYSGGRWIDLDPSTNELAKKMIQSSKTIKGHMVKMTGMIKRNEFHATNFTEVKE